MNPRVSIVDANVDLSQVQSEWVLFGLPDEKYSMLAVETLERLIIANPNVDLITFEGHSEPTVERLDCPAPIVRPHERVVDLKFSSLNRKALEHFFKVRSSTFACYSKRLLERSKGYDSLRVLACADRVLCFNQHLLIRLNKPVSECEQVKYAAFIRQPAVVRRWLNALVTNVRHSFRWLYVPVRQWYARRKLSRYLPGVVNRVHMAFKTEKVRYVVDFGGLIGFMREGWFLKHDMDIDFCLLPGETARRACEALEHAGFEFVRVTVCSGRITKLIMLDPVSGIDLDIFLMYEKDGCVVHEAYFPPYGDLERYSGWRYLRPMVTGVSEKTFRGSVTVMIPDNYDELLTAHYGDWRHPNKAWGHNQKDFSQKLERREIIRDYAHQIWNREYLNK